MATTITRDHASSSLPPQRRKSSISALKTFIGLSVCTVASSLTLHRSYAFEDSSSATLLVGCAVLVFLLSSWFDHVPANVVTDLLQDRVHKNVKDNWKTHTLRSVAEIMLWVHCSDVIYRKTGGNAWDALCLGMTSGFFIVVIVHFVMMFLESAFKISQHNTDFLGDKQVVLFLVLFVLARQFHYGDGLYLGTITLTGVVLMAVVRILALGGDSSHLFVEVMQDRIFSSKRNWIERPTRTLVELSLLLFSCVCAYTVLGDILAALVIGGASGVEYCILHMQYMKEKKSSSAPLTGFGFSLLILLLGVYIVKDLNERYEVFPSICLGRNAPHCTESNTGVAHLVPIVWVTFLLFGVINSERNWELSRVVGKFVIERYENTLQHWKAQPLRSFIEIFLWLHLTECSSRMTLVTNSIPMLFLIGAISAYIIFHFVGFSRILIGQIEALGLTSTSSKIRSRSRISSATGIDGPYLTDRQLAIFLVLYTISRKIFSATKNQNNNNNNNNATLGQLLFVALFGVLTLTIVRLAAKTKSTERVFGEVVMDRILNAKRNWRERPVRTTIENVMWIALFVLSYVLLQDGLAAAVLGFSGGIAYSVLMTYLPKSFRKFVLKKFKPFQPEDVTRSKEDYIVQKTLETSVFKVPGTRNLAIIENETLSSEQKMIQIDGRCYDVAKFAPRHPGGAVIYEFVNKDASTVFSVFHSKRSYGLLKNLEVKTEKTFKTSLEDPAEQDFRDLVERFHREGWFEPDTTFLFKKVLVCVGLLLTTCVSLSSGWIWISAISLGLFWKQSAYIVHDEMHLQCLQDRKYDQVVGWIFGNVCLGASSTWWTAEHYPHHVHTNTVIENVGSGDPQQREEVFCQSETLRAFIPNRICKLLVKLQHVLFVPILILFGRFGLCGASYTMQQGWREHLGVAIHWIWVAVLLSQCDTWIDCVILWYGAAVVQGLLGLFLCLGHYDKKFVEKTKSMKMSWLRRQIEVTKDVDAPWYMDWFYGGLNLHTVHHLLPRLCRSRYRAADLEIRKLCAKHKIQIDRVPFGQALSDVLNHMRQESWRESWRDIFLSS